MKFIIENISAEEFANLFIGQNKVEHFKKLITEADQKIVSLKEKLDVAVSERNHFADSYSNLENEFNHAKSEYEGDYNTLNESAKFHREEYHHLQFENDSLKSDVQLLKNQIESLNTLIKSQELKSDPDFLLEKSIPIIDALIAGNKLLAIKLLKNTVKCGLLEAKDAVEKHGYSLLLKHNK